MISRKAVPILTATILSISLSGGAASAATSSPAEVAAPAAQAFCLVYKHQDAARTAWNAEKKALPPILEGFLGTGAAGKQAKALHVQYLVSGGVPDPNSQLIFSDTKDGNNVRDNSTTRKAYAAYVNDIVWPAVARTSVPTLAPPATPASLSLKQLGLTGEPKTPITWAPPSPTSGPVNPKLFPNIVAGGISGGGGVLGTSKDTRVFGGSIDYVPDADDRGVLTGLTAVTDMNLTVDDSIDFCPGGAGGFFSRQILDPLSNLETTPKTGTPGHWTTPFRFEIGVDFDTVQTRMKATLPVTSNDPDTDGWPNTQPWSGANYPLDNCPGVANADQADANNNGIGDACDSSPQGAVITLPRDGDLKIQVLGRDALNSQSLQLTSPEQIDICDDCQGGGAGEAADVGPQVKGAQVIFLEDGVSSTDGARAKILSESEDNVATYWTIGFEDGGDADYNDLTVGVTLDR